MITLQDSWDFYIEVKTNKGLKESTLSTYGYFYKKLKVFLSEFYPKCIEDISKINGIVVNKFLSFCKKTLNELKVKHHYVMLKGFFNTLERYGYVDENPCKKVEIPKVNKCVKHTLTRQNVLDLIDSFECKSTNVLKQYLAARNKLVINMLITTGIRVSELVSVTIEMIKNKAMLIHGKGGKDRLVPICSELKECIEEYLPIRTKYLRKYNIPTDCGYLLLGRSGMPIGPRGVQNLLKEAGKMIGIEGTRVSPHTFRHTMATIAITNGISAYALMHALGHENLEVTTQYVATLPVTTLGDDLQRTNIFSTNNRYI